MVSLMHSSCPSMGRISWLSCRSFNMRSKSSSRFWDSVQGCYISMASRRMLAVQQQQPSARSMILLGIHGCSGGSGVCAVLIHFQFSSSSCWIRSASNLPMAYIPGAYASANSQAAHYRAPSRLVNDCLLPTRAPLLPPGTRHPPRRTRFAALQEIHFFEYRKD